MTVMRPLVMVSTLLAAGVAVAASGQHHNAATNYNKLDEVMGHNSVRAHVSTTDWTNRVSVSGLFNVQATYANQGWGQPGVQSKYQAGVFGVLSDAGKVADAPHTHGVFVNNANLLVDAKVNHYTNAHVGLVYQAWAGSNLEGFSGAEVDEAYLTISDFAHNPFFLQVGKEFTPFGNYDPYPQTYSLPQLLAQTNDSVVRFGYVGDNGINGSVWVFNGPMSGPVAGTEGNYATRIRNFGASLGYRGAYAGKNYAITAGYVQDIRDSDFISSAISSRSIFANGPVAGSVRSNGLALHGEMASGPFYFDANYVGALGNIGGRQPSAIPAPSGVTQTGTRIWAYEMNADYAFNAAGYDSHARLGYQRSGQADVGVFNMPRIRYVGDYTAHVAQHTDVAVQYVHNEDYKQSAYSSVKDVEGTGRNSNVASVRLSVRF